ncbi:hypothetical protein [Flavobacterium davisii]|uniref:Uncharacterized protein n=1 Tax=Flavobacterium columnare TaxID=996 RepID=A0A8G0KRX6_9FLAO|nr:hypothetical protein [Flavobacterium davisii]QYS89062.1 hypothetical protein JJC05_01050 [Flavobacterium davisii]
MNAYEFIIKMQDMASSSLQRMASSVGVADNRANRLNDTFGKVEKSSASLSNQLNNIKGLIASVFAVGAIMSFGNKVVEARAEYEKFNAVLTNTFQSDKVGAAALNMLTDFATKTPFQLNELTGSFVKLVNRGFNPTANELTKLGDLASSQGKGFDQLTEAMLDAQTGEFERLKEFGIKASKNGDKVMLSFKGVTKEVKNNESAIRDALMQYGEMTGVAGSMNAISQTLGGKISNLADQWNNFLVAVGGESGGIFTGVISLLSQGLAFLTTYLPYVSQWFDMLWQTIKPVFIMVGKLITEFFGFESAGNTLQTFGNIMTGVLMVVDYFVTGLMSPLGQGLLKLVGGWYLLNGAVAVFNMLMAVNPITWVVMGIVALITVLGLVIKYTDGWAQSWKHTVNGAKLIWQVYVDYVKAQFNTLVNGLMIGIDKIKLGWYKFKEAVGMGDSGQNQKMIAQINTDVENQKKSFINSYKKIGETARKAKNEFSQVGVTFDMDGVKKDWNKTKSMFSGLGKKDSSTSAYDDFIAKQKSGGLMGKGGGKSDAKNPKKSDSIVSGGSKMTHITVNIENVGTDTVINVDSSEKGIDKFQEKIQEAVLRVFNSINQMQSI